METPAATGSNVTVRLIDSSLGHIIQTWRFESPLCITIGRAHDRDISISDSYVSRLHAELRRRGNEWWLVSQGRHGVLVEGRSVDEMRVHDGLTFRLGANGPLLQFQNSIAHDPNMSATAEGFDLQAMAELQVDKNRLSREVSEIIDGDYFQQLQQRAREFRQQRHQE